MKKHLFLSSMHPDQNFKLWYYEILIKRGGVVFRDILNFNNNEEEAIKIEGVSFDSDLFNKAFRGIGLDSVNKDYLNNLSNYNVEYIHFHGDSHFRNFLYPETVIELCKKHVCIGYLGDCFVNFNINIYWLPVFNIIRTTEYCKFSDYKAVKPDVIWQKMGSNNNIFKLYNGGKKYDLIFIGRPYGSRVETLEYIVTSIPSIKLALYGSKEWLNSKILSRYYSGYISNDNLHSEISRSKISLALLEGEDGTTPHINAKIFDSSLRDVLVISTYFALLEEQYSMIDEESIVFFKNKDDLVEKINFYLSNDAKRSNIALNMNNLMKKNTMSSIINNMFNSFEKMSGSGFTDSSNMRKSCCLVNKNSVNLIDISKYKYIVVTNSKSDKYLNYLINYWDSHEMLSDINIPDINANGLVLNYRIPISFDGIIYRVCFFQRHKRIILSNVIFIKYFLFLFNFKEITLLRMVLFSKNKLSLAEKIMNLFVVFLKKIKNKYII